LAEVLTWNSPHHLLNYKYKGMQFKFTLGVDMSKSWFNYCLMNPQFDILIEGQIDNTPQAISSFLTELMQEQNIVTNKVDFSQIVLVMEYTGIYVNHLSQAYLAKQGALSLVHAPKVSSLLGGQQQWDEKNDALDARRLAEYGIRYSDKLRLCKPKDDTILKLQVLQRQRSRLINALNTLEVPVKESLSYDSPAISEMLINNQSKTVEAMNEELNAIEKQLSDLIQQDPNFKQMFKLMNSVPGIGPVIAREIIIATSGFSDFLPNQAKQFARYAGVTPKDKQSGIRARSKKTTKRGNKKLKALLTMGATALIGGQSDLGFYYSKKIALGKKHFSVINAMRNKLILRVFAVVRNQIMYDENLNVSIN